MGLNSEQVRYLERLFSDSRRPYYERVNELSSFLGTKILSDEERHSVKRLVNKTTFSEYELIRGLGSPEELSEWYDLTERAINKLNDNFNVNKSKLHHYAHNTFVAEVVASGQEMQNEARKDYSSPKGTSLLSLVGALFRPFSRKN